MQKIFKLCAYFFQKIAFFVFFICSKFYNLYDSFFPKKLHKYTDGYLTLKIIMVNSRKGGLEENEEMFQTEPVENA